MVQRWHVQTAMGYRRLDPLSEQRWLDRWRKQNGLSDPNVPVDASGC